MTRPTAAQAVPTTEIVAANSIDSIDRALSAFLEVRPRLFGVAYRILGSAADAEDVVQDVWLKWQVTDRSVVRNAPAYLTTSTTRLAINLAQSARAHRETYVGPWLPEPVDTSLDSFLGAERDDDLELAVLVLLEKLSPTERAAYVLREAFNYPYPSVECDRTDFELDLESPRPPATARAQIERSVMKIVVIGGNGLIGSRLCTRLADRGHEVIAASPRSGVNSVTGEGLDQALKRAQVVVDVTNSPSWEDDAVMKFFETSTRNLLAAEAKAGVRHHVALSVVGTERLQESGFFRAKLVQENLIEASVIPYTIIRATQFFEFIGGIAQQSTIGQEVRLPSALMQPISTDDVATAAADYALGPAQNRIVEIAGPDTLGMDEAVRRFLSATGDSRRVLTDSKAPYYGLKVSERSLTPDHADRLAPTHLDDWLGQQAHATAAP